MEELIKAYEEAVEATVGLEAELVRTRELLLDVVNEVKRHPRDGFYWRHIFSCNTLNEYDKIMQGDYLTPTMQEAVHGTEKTQGIRQENPQA